MSAVSTRWGWLLGIAFAFSGNCALAQITPDGTLPNNSNVTLRGNTFNITGGTQAGSNLFHSFGQFSVPTGGTAFFNNAVDIQNIISRVTGGSISNIDGLIRANGAANLFLINPSGIVFGQNASLNVGGSFVASTANAIQFGNLGFFSASNPNSPALLTINPSALFFNQIAAAPIQNNSVAPAGVAPTGFNSSGLRVPDGKSLLLVGGDLTMDGGRLNANGGHVELGGLASAGTVGLGVDGNNLSLSFPAESTRASVSLINGANVDVSAGGGGSIAVNASTLNVTGGSVLRAGIGGGLGSVGAKAGDITLNATGDIKIDGNRSRILNNVQRQGVGNGGNIQITTGEFSLTNGAQLQANTFAQGNAGNVIINATKTVSLNNRSAIFSSVGTISDSPEQRNATKGNGGNIQITTGEFSLTNGSQLVAATYAQGNAGNVIINATKSVSLNGLNSGITSSVGAFSDSPELRNPIKGNGGNIQITTGELSLTNGAALEAATYAQGNAGNVIINATKSVSLNNRSGITSSVGAFSDSPEQRNAIKGNGGNIQITTGEFSLTDGASLEANTLGQGNAGNVIINATKTVSLNNRSAIFSSVGTISDSPEQRNATKGNGGNIQITTGEFSLTNGAGLAAGTEAQGNSGNVIINATKSVSLNDGLIFNSVGSSSDSPEQRNATKGNGGNIQITTGEFSLTNDAQLQAATNAQGNAGNVIINATKSVSLNGGNSSIFSSVGDFSVSPEQRNAIKGNGGNIEITTAELSLTDGASLEASTFAQGNAGNVIINATKSVSLNGRGDIFSSVGSVSDSPEQRNATKGNGGNIQITTGELSLANGAQLVANAFAPGNAGNIEISDRTIRLDNGSITSQTSSGNGGDIKLTAQDYILLRNNSRISTTAGTASAGGDGGNITINAPSGFLIATKGENNDITANAFFGLGGVVKINVLGIYNFNQRSLEDLEKLLGTNDPTKLDPQLLPTNDITAISLTSPALRGQVNIITPGEDPSRGLITLPTVTVAASRLVSSSCGAFGKGGSEFTVTGRGGLPLSPDDFLSPDVVWTDNRLSNTTQQQHASEKPTTKPAKPKTLEIIPATGWVINDKGEVTLISSAPSASSSVSSPTCVQQ